MEYLRHPVSWIILPNASEIIHVGNGSGISESTRDFHGHMTEKFDL